MLIAIDGPAGAGKSTVARALARELGFAHLDSGAMYRCVALAALEAGAGSLPTRPGALGEIARAVTIDPGGRPGDSAGPVLLGGRDVTTAVRTPEVSEAASVVAADGEVRSELVLKQRQLIAHGDWVAEGRDIGTVVAPGAAVKVFLTAARASARVGAPPSSAPPPGGARRAGDARPARQHPRAQSPATRPGRDHVGHDGTGRGGGRAADHRARARALGILSR